MHGGALGAGLLALGALGEVGVHVGVERGQVRFAADLGGEVREVRGRQQRQLLRDGEELIVVARPQLARPHGEADRALHRARELREVVLLKEHLVADATPQGAIASPRSARPHGGAIAAVDLGEQRGLLDGVGLGL